MSETRLKYIISDVDRNGNRRWYLRRPGDRKIRLPGGPKSPDFIEHYVKAMEGYTAKPRAPRGASKRPQPRASRAMSGYIYFLKVGESVKIGFSKNPVKRWDELRTGMLKPCDTFVAIRGSERDERRLHWLLKSSRQHLEWFRATNTVITIMARAARHGVIMTDELGLEESVPLRSHFDGDNSVGLAEEISGGNQ